MRTPVSFFFQGNKFTFFTFLIYFFSSLACGFEDDSWKNELFSYGNSFILKLKLFNFYSISSILFPPNFLVFFFCFVRLDIFLFTSISSSRLGFQHGATSGGSLHTHNCIHTHSLYLHEIAWFTYMHPYTVHKWTSDSQFQAQFWMSQPNLYIKQSNATSKYGNRLIKKMGNI